MFAQLLGMGRGKKEKEKELDDPSDHDHCSELVGDSEGEEDYLPSGSCQSGKHAACQRDTAASPTGMPMAPASHPNGGCAHHATSTTDAPPAYDCCGGKASNGTSPASLGGAQAVGRSIVPAPPAGPAGFSSPAATPTLAIPLDRRAFAVEVAAVERGLHIQLGQAGAKTEAQLGDQQLEAAKRLRHLLVTNRAKIIQELLSRGWVPLLLRWLGLVHRPNLQVETLSALTTVAQNTTEHTPLLLKHGAVGTLVSLLKSPSLEMVEQAMWVLGKMAQDGQDGTTARDAVLQAGVLGPLVRCLEQHPTLLSLQRIGAWSLFNLLDGQPRPTVDVATVNTVMPAINRLLRSGDSEVLSHACSALSHLCDGSSAHIKIVVDSGVCTRLVQLLDHPSSQVVKPALRTIGNVVCAEDDADYTEAILEAGSVDCLKRLIAHPNREIQKEACWTLSNIAAGSVSQIQSVLDSGAMPQLIKLARSADTESEVRSEAYWVVLNAASCGSDAQIEYLVSEGCVQILSDLLGESSMVMMALEGIERVLSVGDLRVVRNAIASHSHAGKVKGAGGGEDHCIECASVAAAAAGGDCNGGGLGCDPGGYMNPYACMLAPEKIQALEAHKDAAVAKRANRVWARYFVTCAICRRSFNRHGRSATFCDECMCHVCRSCDCTVFHLAYQDKLWEEMEGKEKKGKQAQQAAKKSKKAKKREKKKNAAKESVVEPSMDNKSAGVDGAGTGSKNAASGVKRVEGGEKDKAAGVTVERSKVLGQKSQPHRRSPSPHKTSSSASTESNSEDEYTPSPPPNAYTATPAAAIINATAIAVTAAAAKHANQKRQKAAALQQSAVSPTAPKPAATLAASANGTSKVQEEQQRGQGKKQGRRDRGQRPTPGESAPKDADPRGGSPPASAAANPTSVRSDRNAKSEKASDDDNEEPWVVVGSKGGPQAAGAAAGKSRGGGGAGAWGTAGPKQSKGGKGQRAGEPGPGASAPSATLPGGGGGASVVGWASESSPAATARAVTARTKAVSPSPAGAVPRVSPPPLAVAAASVVPTAPPGSGRSASGNAWGIGSGGPMPPQPMSSGVLSPALAANGLRSVTGGVNSPQVAVQRRGPTPGSGWGASLPTVDARPKPLSAAVAPPGAILGQVSRAPGPVNRAGVIGPPSQATTGGRLASSASKPVGSPTLPCARNPPLAAPASISALSASSLGGGGGGGSVGFGNIVSGRSGIPAQQGLAGRSTANGQLVRSSSVTGDGEALVENEKLVSFLMETGSILALAQRLEEEEEWRRATPSPASSGRG